MTSLLPLSQWKPTTWIEVQLCLARPSDLRVTRRLIELNTNGESSTKLFVDATALEVPVSLKISINLAVSATVRDYDDRGVLYGVSACEGRWSDIDIIELQKLAISNAKVTMLEGFQTILLRWMKNAEKASKLATFKA